MTTCNVDFVKIDSFHRNTDNIHWRIKATVAPVTNERILNDLIGTTTDGMVGDICASGLCFESNGSWSLLSTFPLWCKLCSWTFWKSKNDMVVFVAR
jgi:hypothetical protein